MGQTTINFVNRAPPDPPERLIGRRAEGASRPSASARARDQNSCLTPPEPPKMSERVFRREKKMLSLHALLSATPKNLSGGVRGGRDL